MSADPAFPYQPFSGANAKCPKCGSSITSSYQSAGTVFVAPGMAREAKGPEWLLRRCTDCDYEWPEMCKDAHPETALL
jgi:hypothetical protein